jgi:hypothetical protein
MDICLKRRKNSSWAIRARVVISKSD